MSKHQSPNLTPTYDHANCSTWILVIDVTYNFKGSRTKHILESPYGIMIKQPFHFVFMVKLQLG